MMKSAGAGPSRVARPASAPIYRIVLEYAGKTGMTAVGPVTGQRYRFDRPGARVVIDPRDHVAMAAVPNLRQVRS
jgi:hypothetical protein